MEATIQRWGNSQGIRIPKLALESFGLSVNDRVKLERTEDGFVAHKVVTPNQQMFRHYQLQSRVY